MGQAPSKSAEDKVRIVLVVLRGEISIAAAARGRALLRYRSRSGVMCSWRAAEAGVHFVDVLGAFADDHQCGKKPWLNGVVVDDRSSDALPLSARSFHPKLVGHERYAAVLLDYITAAVQRGDVLNAAGLPTNPPPTPRSATQQGSGPRGAAGSSDVAKSASGTSDTSSDPEGEPEAAAVQNTVLWARRVGPGGARCGGFLAPADRVALSVEGFAADSAVSFSVVAATVSGAVLPAVLEGEDSSTPRVYLVKATGTDTAGAALVEFIPGPMLAYPAVAPCAADDVATTAVGRPVRVAVLANDTAPGGSLTLASVTVGAVNGGAFSVNPADGSLTFTPDPGFVGAAAVSADPQELAEAIDAAGALSGLFTAPHGLQGCALGSTGEAAC